MDTLKALQVYVAVVDRGSQSAAAEQLGLSRPIVSRCLAELEAWTGARLMHRTTRRLSLTAAGNEILPRARALLEMADDMRHAVAAPESAPRGLLRITASAAFSHAQLAAAVADYARRHPAVSVDLVLAEHAVNLVDERIDLAIRIASELDPNLIARRLTVCRSVVCASPAYLAAHAAPRRVEDLGGHNCLTHGQHGKSLWHFERDGETLSVAVGGSLSANDAASLAQAALAGTGIAMLPTYLAASMIQAGQLVALLPETPPRVLQIHAVYASRKHMSAALRTMLDFLAERFGAEPAWDRPPQRR